MNQSEVATPTSVNIAPVSAMREKVERLEASMMGMPQAHCPVRHYFAPGLYAREMSIAAGVTVTGAIHKTENLIAVTMGRLLMVTEDGAKEVCAGDVLICPAGRKNAVTALEDSRWVNFMANPGNETDTDKLVEVFTESKASELLGGSDNPQLAAARAAQLEN